MRARLLSLVLVHLVVSACGTGVFVHTFEIAVADPAGRLGPPPVEVGIFDHTMGRWEEWARRTAGTAAPGAPYRGAEGRTVVPLSATVRSQAGGGAWAFHVTLELPPAGGPAPAARLGSRRPAFGL